ncbi:hypothetical protein ACVJGD_005518 [Bradyrhizobium sp. USDA 10063]
MQQRTTCAALVFLIFVVLGSSGARAQCTLPYQLTNGQVVSLETSTPTLTENAVTKIDPWGLWGLGYVAGGSAELGFVAGGGATASGGVGVFWGPSEICNLRLEDINWRAESIRIRHTKTKACSFLPLMEPVGEAVLAYLCAGRWRAMSGKSSSARVRPITSSGCWTAWYDSGCRKSRRAA